MYIMKMIKLMRHVASMGNAYILNRRLKETDHLEGLGRNKRI